MQRRQPLRQEPAERGSDAPADTGGGGDGVLRPRSRKMKAAQRPRPAGGGSSDAMRALLRDLLEQQHRLDVQRQEAVERRARERLVLEQQWRQSMQMLQRERLALERAWMDREEQRRIREEARAERRDALLTSLLHRLLQDDL